MKTRQYHAKLGALLWVGAGDRGPGLGSSVTGTHQTLHRGGLRRAVSHPDAICSSCHNAGAGKRRELAGRIPDFIFLFLRRSWEFFCGGKETHRFPWTLPIHFAVNKMASLSEKGVKTGARQ